MKESIFSKLFRIKEKWKFFLLFLVSILVLILPSMVVTKYSIINGNLTCNMIEKNELSCKFTCNVILNYDKTNIEKELNGRVIVFHSVWSAIYDRTYEMQVPNKNSFDIELPKRNYKYSVVVSMYDNEGKIGVSNNIVLLC